MAVPNDDMEMEKIAEDELAKLQRQFRIMEIDRAAVTTSVQPTLRVQRNIIRILNSELEKVLLELRVAELMPGSTVEVPPSYSQILPKLFGG